MVAQLKDEQKLKKMFANFENKNPDAAKEWNSSFYPDRCFNNVTSTPSFVDKI